MHQGVNSCLLGPPPRLTSNHSGRRIVRTPFRSQATSQSDSDSSSQSKDAAAQNVSPPTQRPIPWAITFDIRERETIWTDENKARLVKKFAALELGLDDDMLSYRLRQITLLLPDLNDKVASIKPALLAEILSDPALVAERCVRLRDALPHANVSQMVALQPSLLLEEADVVVSSIEKLGELLGVDAQVAQSLVTTDPRFVDAEAVEEVLEEMSRLMPKQDPKMVLLRDPSWLLRVERGTKRLGPHPDDI